MLTLGIDSGSSCTKAVVFDGKSIIESKIMPTGANPQNTIDLIYQQFTKDKIDYIITTGYGRNLLSQADKKITEITCHARGAAFLNPETTKIIDIGGQDSKVIALNRNLQVEDFLMNDKCAAGTGRFIEMMMNKLEQPLDNIDAFAANHQPVEINSMCAVFAESEIISLLAQGADPGDIVLGVIESICKRVASFSRQLENSGGSIFLSGGLAKSMVFRKTMEKHLQQKIYTHELSQYAGAIGAAIIAHEKIALK
ncbi:MAG: acyl-CoA dehydratase activase [Bacillota bacterium]|jgi:predicted CoA-substrate-specific enzyme activase